MSVFSMILAPVTEVINKVIDKAVPDADKRLEAKHEAQMELLALQDRESKDFAKRVLAEIQHPNWFRDAVRPIVTYSAWALYMFVKVVTVYMVTVVYWPMMKMLATAGQIKELIDALKQYRELVFSEWDVWILLCIIGFWFGPKAIERLSQTGKELFPSGSLLGRVKGMIGLGQGK